MVRSELKRVPLPAPRSTFSFTPITSVTFRSAASSSSEKSCFSSWYRNAVLPQTSKDDFCRRVIPECSARTIIQPCRIARQPRLTNNNKPRSFFRGRPDQPSEFFQTCPEIHPDRTLLNNGDAHFHSCKQFVLSATKLGCFLVRDNVEHSMLQWTAKHARQDTPQSNKLTA